MAGRRRFKRGHVHGRTDDFSYRPWTMSSAFAIWHATLLHALGLDHTRLTFPHEGRDDSLTDAGVTGRIGGRFVE